MVAKKGSRIARNPKEKAMTAEVDKWIDLGGVDPEVRELTPNNNNQTTAEENPEGEQTKKYPHRISFDIDKELYKRLKWSAFNSERSMNEILREAVDEWMQARDY
jgi:hypothetical protein